MENQDQAAIIPGIDDAEPAALPQVDELTALKSRADLMGLTYHPSIGLEKLRAKVTEAIEAEGKPVIEQEEAPIKSSVPVPTSLAKAAVAAEPTEETPGQKRVRMKREQLALVRINVTCMNPAKKEWDGEIFTAGNALIGSVSKYVPFAAENGWHVPRIIYQVMKDRMCQVFVTVTNEKKQKVRQGKLIREFALEVLDPLTKEELAELAARQAATRAIA